MSDRIKRMLAERETAARAHEGAKRRGLWSRIGRPREKAYRFGFDLVRDYLAGQPRSPADTSLAEGMVMGMMDGFIQSSAEGWRFSSSRKAAIAEVADA